MKYLIGFTFTLLFASTSFSQETTSKKLDLGFYLEGNYTFLERSESINSNTITENNSAGFGLGISAEYKLKPKFSLVAIAGLSLSKASLDYNLFASSYVYSKTLVYNQNLDFRLQGHYAFGNKPSRPYVLLGPSVMTPLNFNVEETSNFPISATALSVDLGFGFNTNLKYFRFAPEIRYSYGLNSILSSPYVSQLRAHRVTLTLHFKG